MRRLKRLWKDRTIIAKLGILLLIGFVIVIAGDYAGLSIFSWAGVSNYTKPSALYEPGKSLWDWLDLLIIPAVLAGGALWLNQSERRTEREIADQRSQEATLQAYLDRMTELLLEKGLRTSEEDDEVRAVARARTLTALRQLDEMRKGTLVRFLYEAGLIDNKTPVINLIGADLKGAGLNRAGLTLASLSGADLSVANLRRADLSGADLSWANLSGANLSGAYLRDANLIRSNLNGSNLNGTDLQRANLSKADLSGADLFWASSGSVNLSGIIYDGQTEWPHNFTPPPDAIKKE